MMKIINWIKDLFNEFLWRITPYIHVDVEERMISALPTDEDENCSIIGHLTEQGPLSPPIMIPDTDREKFLKIYNS